MWQFIKLYDHCISLTKEKLIEWLAIFKMKKLLTTTGNVSTSDSIS